MRAGLRLIARNVVGLCGTAVVLWTTMAAPQRMPALYSVLISALVLWRAILWSQKKWLYYLTDFCYFVNILLLHYLWRAPESAVLFKSVFMFSCGVLGWSAVIFKNGLIFHSIDQLTSSWLHLGPAIVVWLLRWNRSVFDGIVVCLDTNCTSDAYDTFAVPWALWLLWAVSYYVMTFHVLREWLARGQHETLYAYLVPASGAGLIGAFCNRGIARARGWQPAMFMVAFGLLWALTGVVACVCWASYHIHTACLLLQIAGSVWEGVLRYGAMADAKWAEIEGFTPVVQPDPPAAAPTAAAPTAAAPATAPAASDAPNGSHSAGLKRQ